MYNQWEETVALMVTVIYGANSSVDNSNHECNSLLLFHKCLSQLSKFYVAMSMPSSHLCVSQEIQLSIDTGHIFELLLSS